MKRCSVLLSIIVFFVLSSYFPGFCQEQASQGQPTQDQPERQPGKIFPRGFPLRLEKILNLTPEQKTKLDEFRKAGQEERQAFFDQMRKLRTEFRESMRAPQTDEKKIDSLIDEMSRLRAAQLKNSLKSAREMKKILTPEQLEKMDQFRSRMRDRRGRGMGPFMGRGGFYGHGWMNPRWGRRHFWRPGPMNWMWRRW